MKSEIRLELRDIQKTFGNVRANDGVNLDLYTSEIHALLGENGSGKSTLMNILSGLYAPDNGQIILDGRELNIRSPRDAISYGIGMIHQHFKLIDSMTVWENIAGGINNGCILKKKEIVSKARKLCSRFGFELNMEKTVHQLSISEKQTVEIIKTLYQGADILILDEPTAVLTEQEIDRLFQTLIEMKKANCSIVIITHKLQEVKRVSDRVTVLRKGRSVYTGLTSQTSSDQLVQEMVGRKVDLSVPHMKVDKRSEKPVLSIRDLSVRSGQGHALKIDALDVYGGEILGIAGIAGSGQKELCEAVNGLEKVSGSIRLNGKEIAGLSPYKMRRRGIGIGFVPEDRLGMGLAGSLSIMDNTAMRTYYKEESPFRKLKAEREQADEMIRDYHVSATGSMQMVSSLSGGNIQKILLGREINRQSNLLVMSYPVRGLDIGASEFIYDQMNRQKKNGTAILFVGEDLDALIGISDRIAVLHNGEIMGIFDADTVTKEKLGLYMLGQK